MNAGGRRFKTKTTTLLSSGSAYLAALLGMTGAALGSLSHSENAAAVTPHGNGRKRVRRDVND